MTGVVSLPRRYETPSHFSTVIPKFDQLVVDGLVEGRDTGIDNDIFGHSCISQIVVKSPYYNTERKVKSQ